MHLGIDSKSCLFSAGWRKHPRIHFFSLLFGSSLYLYCIFPLFVTYDVIKWTQEHTGLAVLMVWQRGKSQEGCTHNSICAVSTTNIWFIPLTKRSSRICQHLSLYTKSSVQRFFSLFLMSCVVSLGDLFKAPLQSKICFLLFPTLVPALQCQKFFV